MSDADKPTPEGAPAASPEIKVEPIGAFGRNVISIEAARAELLRKPKTRSAGVIDLSRPRGREVPSPVTMPPGEHSAVIVADTPAARAHFEKKTVHPGEAPVRVHDKKVRVKTSLDPRRAKTQVSDKRGIGPDGQPIPFEDTGAGNVESLWNPKSQSPPSMADGRISGELRPSGYARKSSAPPPPREAKKGSPLFLAGVAVSAALGAVLVFMLTRHTMQPSPPPAATSLNATATLHAVFPPAMPSAVASTAPAASSAPSAPSDTPAALTAPVAPQPTDTAAAGASSGGNAAAAIKTSRPLASTKPALSATVAPSASAKPTATSILPFGKEEP